MGPRAYGCRCERCMNWHKTIAAQNPDGSYCFSDQDLYDLAMQEDYAEEQIQ